MPDDFQIIRDSDTPRKRYRRTRRVLARLQQLADNPYDKDGTRLVLRMPSNLAHCVRTCARDLKLRIQVSRFDQDDKEWIKVFVLQEGERSGQPGRPPVSRVTSPTGTQPTE